MSNNFETAYSCFEFVKVANNRREEYKRIFDVLVPNFVGKPFTVREVGEYMMGEDYHVKSGEFYDLRVQEARDLTAQITALLRAMKTYKKVKSWQAKDYAHPHTFDTVECYYEWNGVTYPDYVEVTAPSGSMVKVPTKVVFPQAVKRTRDVTKTVYPKVTYYQFV